MGEPYGWSQDAVDALLAVLFAVGQMRIVNASGTPWPAGKFNGATSPPSTFSRETAPLSNEEKRAIARLVKCKPDEAETRAPEFVTKLQAMRMARATGAAPRPEAKPNELIDELSATSGRDLVKRLAEEEKVASRLLGRPGSTSNQDRPTRTTMAPARHAAGRYGRPPGRRADRRRVRGHPTRPPAARRPGQGRTARQSCGRCAACRPQSNLCAYRQEYEQCIKEIEASAEWAKLSPEDRAAILREVQLSSPESAPRVGTLNDLIDSLATCSPQRWTEKRHALRGQLSRALTAAARKLEPTVQPITPPRRIVRSEADLDTWLSEVRQSVLAKLPDGPVQL